MIRLSQDRTRTLLAIHGWSGVLLGLLLYTVILTGTLAVFAEQIGDWASPAGDEHAPALPAGLDARLRELAAVVDPEYLHEVSIWPRAGGRVQVFFHDHVPVAGEAFPQDIGVEFDLHPQTLAVLDRREGFGRDIDTVDTPNALADFLVELHVSLHLPDPWGLLLTGVLGLAMLVAAVTGLVIHRHLLKELFTVRRWRNSLLRRRDLHAVAGTWNLPFAFILAFTGSYFSFAGAVGIPLMAEVAFGGDQVAMFDTLIGTPPPENPGRAALADLDTMLADARVRAQGPAAFVHIEHWNRADAQVTVFARPRSGELLSQNLVYAGAEGSFVRQKPGLGLVPSAGGTAMDLMGPLHFGNFAGLWSKAAWFALGFASCYVTLTGLNLWTARRAAQDRRWQALARATAWVGYGLPMSLGFAAIGYFLGLALQRNALELPMALALAGGALLALIPVLRCDDHARIRRLLLRACAACLGVLPLLRWASGGPGWLAALDAGQITVPAMDLVLLLGAVVCLRAARRSAAARSVDAEPPAADRLPEPSA